jgi:hypothetical protein
MPLRAISVVMPPMAQDRPLAVVDAVDVLAELHEVATSCRPMLCSRAESANSRRPTALDTLVKPVTWCHRSPLG